MIEFDSCLIWSILIENKLSDPLLIKNRHFLWQFRILHEYSEYYTENTQWEISITDSKFNARSRTKWILSNIPMLPTPIAMIIDPSPMQICVRSKDSKVGDIGNLAKQFLIGCLLIFMGPCRYSISNIGCTFACLSPKARW